MAGRDRENALVTPTPAVLALEDGTVFRGISIGASGVTTGEVVFNTAMTGYQEILTDPSYSRQIVTLTYPHIGNVGTTPEDMESAKIYAAGLVVRDLSMIASNWRSTTSLQDFLERGRIVAKHPAWLTMIQGRSACSDLCRRRKIGKRRIHELEERRAFLRQRMYEAYAG